MPDNVIALMAHLLRRAGFGATTEELERYPVKGYEPYIFSRHRANGVDSMERCRL